VNKNMKATKYKIKKNNNINQRKRKKMRNEKSLSWNNVFQRERICLNVVPFEA
jgi:hypothetical protein